jgi:hypothetical protein
MRCSILLQSLIYETMLRTLNFITLTIVGKMSVATAIIIIYPERNKNESI